MNITFLSNPKELRKVRVEVEIYCKSYLPNLDTSKVILAIDEAIQNIIRHAYNMKTDKKIDINIDTLDETSLKLEIIDYGKQVPLDTIAPRNLEDVKPGGLGVYFIKKCSKFCEYKHNANGLGTTLTLIF